MPLHVPAITFAWVHLSLLSNVCRMKLTRLLHTLWRMNLCLPSLKKWGHCVAGLLISVKLHVTWRAWHESPLAFCPNFGICAKLNMVHLGIVCILIQVSNQLLMENMKMVNNRALRSSMPSIHLSSYICYELGGIHSINSWHRLLYRRCYEHISECSKTCSADLFSYVTCASSIWSGLKVVRVVVHVDSSVYLHPDFD
jgi:nitrate reductase gamma subunit